MSEAILEIVEQVNKLMTLTSEANFDCAFSTERALKWSKVLGAEWENLLRQLSELEEPGSRDSALEEAASLVHRRGWTSTEEVARAIRSLKSRPEEGK